MSRDSSDRGIPGKQDGETAKNARACHAWVQCFTAAGHVVCAGMGAGRRTQWQLERLWVGEQGA